MSQILMPLILGVFFVLLVTVAWQLSRLGDWFIVWARGCIIFGTLLLALCMLLLAYEVTRFSPVVSRSPLATITIKSTDSETFLAEIRDSNKNEWYTSLSGDAWQISARGLSYSGLAAALTSHSVAKASTISTRFYDFERRENARTIDIAPSSMDGLLGSLDFSSWSLFSRIDPILNLLGVHRQELMARVVPLVDGTSYLLYWADDYIEVKPANEVAQESLQSD